MACCLMAPNHYLNQCWLIISKVQWHPSECSFTRDTSAISHWNQLEIFLSKIFFKSPRGQWVNMLLATSCAFYHNNDNFFFISLGSLLRSFIWSRQLQGCHPQRVIFELTHWPLGDFIPLHAKFFRGNINMYILCHYSTLIWNRYLNASRTYIFYIVNIMAADVLAT